MLRHLIPIATLPAFLSFCGPCGRCPCDTQLGPDCGDTGPEDSQVEDSLPGDSGDSLPDDSDDSLPDDTDDTDDTGDPAPTLVSGDFQDGSRWWVVTLDVEQRTLAVVIAPPDGESGRYEAGAPVVMGVGSGITTPVECNDSPMRTLRTHAGMVVVQFLTPGQCCVDVCSPTSDNIGGSVSRQAVSDLRDFALNSAQTLEGDTLSSLVGTPMMEDELVLILGSSRATTVVENMAADPDSWDMVRAVINYEVPYYPAMVALELGATMHDPDLSEDADEDRLPANDGRYPHYQDGDCADGECRLDHVPLGFDQTVAIRDVHHDADMAVIAGRDRPGVLYADGNRNGMLDLQDTHVDYDRDGLVERGEDFVFFGLIQDSGVRDEQYWHSPELLREALIQGVLTEDAWPPHFPTLGEVQVFWGERDHPTAQQQVVDALPDIYWVVLGAHQDHGQALSTRPHTVLMYNDLLEAGMEPQYNFSNDALEEIYGTVAIPYEPLSQGAPMTEENVRRYAPPFDLSEAEVRGAGVVHACDLLYAE